MDLVRRMTAEDRAIMAGIDQAASAVCTTLLYYGDLISKERSQRLREIEYELMKMTTEMKIEAQKTWM